MDNGVRIGNPPARAPGASAVNARNLFRLWPLMAAGVVMAGLLFSLTTVLQQAVQQAQARHAGTAARAEAHFRCNTLARSDERSECRARAGGQVVSSAASNP